MTDIALTITPAGGGAAVTLARSPGRSGDGSPVGPDGLEFRTEKGVLDREPIGADGIDSEHVGCDRRTLTFAVTRVYASEQQALAGLAALEAGCPAQGKVTLGGKDLIEKATLRGLSARLKGCELSAVYTFEGY